jgi:hypothetical protein
VQLTPTAASSARFAAFSKDVAAREHQGDVVVACGAYYPSKQQVIWMVSVDGGNTPTLGIKIHTNELRDDDEGFLRGGISLITARPQQRAAWQRSR